MKSASSRQIKRLSKLLPEDPNIQARVTAKRTMPSPSQRTNGRFYDVDGSLVEAEGDEVLESALRSFNYSHIFEATAGQASQAKQLNNRIIAMIRMVNAAHNSTVPETEEGYNQLGRSQGVVELLTNPIAFSKLVGSGMVQIDKVDMTNILTKFISNIPR